MSRRQRKRWKGVIGMVGVVVEVRGVGEVVVGGGGSQAQIRVQSE